MVGENSPQRLDPPLPLAMDSLALLGETHLAVLLSLAFGLIGMAPAGVIMALTGEDIGHAITDQRRSLKVRCAGC